MEVDGGSWDCCSVTICCCIAAMFLERSPMSLARSPMVGSAMGIEEESVEWVGELGVEDWDAAAEAEERWPEDQVVKGLHSKARSSLTS